MHKYSNRREFNRVGGKFAKPKSLEQLGFPINNEGRLVCPGCGHASQPILKPANCPKCHGLY